jgi:hypothetical protein
MKNKIKNLVESAQSLPATARVRILWTVSIFIGILLVGVWVFSSTRQINNVGVDDINLTGSTANNQPTNQTKYITVEWVEKKDNKLWVYFKARNNTQSILNLPAKDNITLSSSGKDYKPEGIFNRQSQTFVVKVLSDTTDYGYLVFEGMDLQPATIEFKSMFFENQQDIQFTEKYEINLKALNKPLELRS